MSDTTRQVGPVEIQGPATEDEAAAVAAVIELMLIGGRREETGEPVPVWALAGRREAQGLVVETEQLGRGWGR